MIKPYIVPDAVVFHHPEHYRRMTIYIGCPKCHKDFDVRDGEWVNATLPSGALIRIKVCDSCKKDETPSSDENACQFSLG